MENLEQKDYDIEQKIRLAKEELLRKQEAVKLAEENLKRFKYYRILTRKELKELEKEKLENKRKQFEERKSNIRTETDRLFEEAKRVRLKADSKSEDERRIAEKQALEIETKALKSEVEILSYVLEEKNELFKELLARKMCKLCDLKKLKFYKESQISNKVEAGSLISNIKNLTESYLKLKKEIRDIDFRIRKSSEKFSYKWSMLNNY